LIIIDPEDEYFPQEVIQIHHAVKNKGLNLIVVGNWYNKKLLEKMSFEDSNLKQPSYPITGGANVPAINELLNPFGFALGDQVVEGTIKLSNKNIKIASGSNLKAVPTSAWIVTADLNDIVCCM
jgi:membrane-bound transcription factor site-1 protease